VPLTPSVLTTEDYQTQLENLFTNVEPKPNSLTGDFTQMYERMTAPDLDLRECR